MTWRMQGAVQAAASLMQPALPELGVTGSAGFFSSTWLGRRVRRDRAPAKRPALTVLILYCIPARHSVQSSRPKEQGARSQEPGARKRVEPKCSSMRVPWPHPSLAPCQALV